MIDKDAFTTGMALLAGAYGREVDGAVTRMYYGVLAPQLTTEEFERAVSETIATERFWPAPSVLLENAGKAAGESASRALAHVVDRLRARGGFRFFPHEEFQAFDEATKAGVRAVGGLREITLVDVDRFPSLEKKFTRAYVEVLRQAPALPPAPEPQLALTGERR